MGREIRKVPADWQHPVYTQDDAPRSEMVGKLRAIYDQDYDTAAEEWLRNCNLWQRGEHPDQKKGNMDEYRYFWDWHGGPPDRACYRERKWTAEEATHFIVYETVSEGTPVTPAFATKEELVNHLVREGTSWDNGKGWPREAAEQFVKHEWAPSLIMRPDVGVKQVNEVGFYE